MINSLLPVFSITHPPSHPNQAKPDAQKKPQVFFGASLAKLDLFTQKDLDSNSERLPDSVFRSDVFERRLSNGEGTITSRQLADRIVDNLGKRSRHPVEGDESQPRHFLIEADGQGGMGKTFLTKRLLSLLQEKKLKPNQRIDSIYILMDERNQFDDRKQEIENTQSPFIIAWDEYQFAHVDGEAGQPDSFQTPLTRAMRRNKNVSLIAVVSTGIRDLLLDQDEIRKMNALFPPQNRFKMSRPEIPELLDAFDFMLNYAGFKVSDNPPALAREQGNKAGKDQALSNQQKIYLLINILHPRGEFASNPNFTQVLLRLRERLKAEGIGTGNTNDIEIIPFSLVLDSFDRLTHGAWQSERRGKGQQDNAA